MDADRTLGDAWADSSPRHEWPNWYAYLSNPDIRRELSETELGEVCRDWPKPIRVVRFEEVVGASYYTQEAARHWFDELIGRAPHGSFVRPDIRGRR
jgi:hypothetical protein